MNLSRLADAVVKQLRASQPERAVEFVNEEDVVAQGDAPLLRALLENLIGNAWKFTGARPGARISFGVEDRDGTPVYFVRDNGAGFDMAYAEKLFAPFQRLHTESEFAGTGIGLATVQRIVHRHGGRVWAEGKVGRRRHIPLHAHEHRSRSRAMKSSNPSCSSKTTRTTRALTLRRSRRTTS